jgi:hypothetical protein
MPCRQVEIRGKDGNLHAKTLEATSVFDAASKALRMWCQLWWFDGHELVTVRQEEEIWTVSQPRIREWEKPRLVKPVLRKREG